MGLKYSAPELPALEVESISSNNGQYGQDALKVFKTSGRVGVDDGKWKKKVRIVIVSDSHRSHRSLKIPNGDIFIHCGDFTNHKTSTSDLRDFNEWLNTIPHKYKIVISGNHDVALSKSVELNRQKMCNATYLQDETIEIEGIKIHGTPWHTDRGIWYLAKAFSAPSHILEQKYQLIPKDIDILISHPPPTQVGLDKNHHNRFMGVPELTQHSLMRVKPRVKKKLQKNASKFGLKQIHCFGHNHDGIGVKKFSHTDHDTVLINSATTVNLQIFFSRAYTKYQNFQKRSLLSIIIIK